MVGRVGIKDNSIFALKIKLPEKLNFCLNVSILYIVKVEGLRSLRFKVLRPCGAFDLKVLNDFIDLNDLVTS